MGRTNDAIIYGGHVHLFVSGPDDEARILPSACRARPRGTMASLRDAFSNVSTATSTPSTRSLQPGGGDRDGPRQRPQLSRRPARSRIPRRLLLVTVSRRSLRSRSPPKRANGTAPTCERPQEARSRVTVLSLRDSQHRHEPAQSLRLPGFSDRLPDGGLPAHHAGGTFEAMTLRLGILHALVARTFRSGMRRARSNAASTSR